eukprot:3637306-Rhodomonas_salina.2
MSGTKFGHLATSLPAGLGMMTQLQNLIIADNPPLFNYVPPDVLNKGVTSTIKCKRLQDRMQETSTTLRWCGTDVSRDYLRALALAEETLHLSVLSYAFAT